MRKINKPTKEFLEALKANNNSYLASWANQSINGVKPRTRE